MEAASVYYENFSFMADQENWKCLKIASEALELYIQESKPMKSESFQTEIKKFLDSSRISKIEDAIDLRHFYPLRWSLQADLVKKFSLANVLLDRDGRTSIAYAMLDIQLLKKVDV